MATVEMSLCHTPQVMSLTRQATFFAVHRLPSGMMDDADNIVTYEGCHFKHGHSYTVEVTLHGLTNPLYGTLVKRSVLSEYIQTILTRLDHKELETDIVFFRTRPSTPENIAIYIWTCLFDIMAEPKLLSKVKLYYTDKKFVVYRGRDHF